MSVPFPFTYRDQDNCGHAYSTRTSRPVRGVNYIQLPCRREYFLDARFQNNHATFAAAVSAYSLIQPPSPCYISITNIHSEVTDSEHLSNLSGSSCGLALFLALLGIRTNVLVTGFIWLTDNPSLEIHEVDSISKKMLYAQRHGMRIIVPFSCFPANRPLPENITTFSSMYSNRGYDLYSACAVVGLSDLAFVLNALDPSVSLECFMPPHMTVVYVSQ